MRQILHDFAGDRFSRLPVSDVPPGATLDRQTDWVQGFSMPAALLEHQVAIELTGEFAALLE